MKIGYMGTPDFAVPALNALHALRELDGEPVEVVFAVTQPDKAKDRGKKIQCPPVKEAAIAMGIPVLQPEKVKGNEEFLRELTEFAPDLIVVAAYGKILPKEILELPPLGCINIHGSLLPKYRGAAPIQRSVMEGETETGVTLMYMAEGLDTGDMIAKVSTPIQRKNAEQLHDELARLGAQLLVETLPALAAGTAAGVPQEDSLSCYAPMVFKQDGLIDWKRSAEEIDRQIRGLTSWPGAYTTCEGRQMKVWEAIPTVLKTEEAPGTVLAAGEQGLDVAAGEGVLRILKLQFPGKRAMLAADFLRGHRLEPGTVLG